jgi:arsenate reductase
VVDYIKNPLSSTDLKLILKHLKINPFDLLRKKETEYKEYIHGKNLNDLEIIDLMVKNPKLIERPIVVWDGKAVVARPLEKLIELVKIS